MALFQFIDGKDREFIDYKGWYIIDGETKVKDVLVSERLNEGSIYTINNIDKDISVPNDVVLFGLSKGNDMYYIQNDSLYRKHIDGHVERIKSLEHIDDENIYIDNRFHQLRRLKGKELAEEIKEQQETIYIKKKGDGHPKNILTKDGYFVFDKWYNSISRWPSGLYEVLEENTYHVIDLNGDIIFPQSTRCINYFHGGLGVVEFEDSYGVIDRCGKIIADGYSSVMMAFCEMWSIDVHHNKKHQLITSAYRDYLPIKYVHEFLRSKYGLGLFEKDLTWYYLNENFEMVPLCKYDIFADIAELNELYKEEGWRPGAIEL